MADNGCQPTALAFMHACAALDIRQAFTSYNNPKGNADTERFLRTLKEEFVWLHEWTSPATFFAALERCIADYNRGYLHSALGYRSPESFEAEHLSHATSLPPSRTRGVAPSKTGAKGSSTVYRIVGQRGPYARREAEAAGLPAAPPRQSLL
jgi:Integrase core domain